MSGAAPVSWSSRRRRGSLQDVSGSLSSPSSSSSSGCGSPEAQRSPVSPGGELALDMSKMEELPARNAKKQSIWATLYGWVADEALDNNSARGRRPQRRLKLQYRAVTTADEPEREDNDEDDALDEEDDDAHAPLGHALLSASGGSTAAGFGLEKGRFWAIACSFADSSWVLLLLLGVTASVVAWSIDNGVQLVTHWRAVFTSLGGGWISDYLLYVSYRVVILLLGVLSTWLVCPDAAGSGIPEMRSILGGFPFPNYLSARAMVAKCFGLVFALGSGLSIGKEGPFVHLSCIIARQLLRLPLFRQIRDSEDLTHHVLSAACAVGVTATFGTPIGGVLFSIEVTTSYYVTSNYWRAFFSSVVGVVVFRSLSTLLRSKSVTLFTTSFRALPYESYEFIFFLALALICGFLAAAFVKAFRAVSKLKTRFLEEIVFVRFPSARSYSPFVYAASVALLFSLIEFPVGSFMLLSQHQVIDDMFSTSNLTSNDSNHLGKFVHYSMFHCIANLHAFIILFTTASEIGASWTSPSLALNLFAYTCVRFFSTAISATVMVPSGIVTPVFAVGAAIGRLFGEIVAFIGGGTQLAGGYAVVGAASFTAGVTGTVSIAVIVFELTSQLSYMVPVLLCVLVGRSVALFFSLDMYETISRQKKLPQWPTLTQQRSYQLSARDLMSDTMPPQAVRCQTLATLKQLLHEASSDIDVFPVVDNDKSNILLGVAERDELEALVHAWERCQTTTKGLRARTRSEPSLALDREQRSALSKPQSEDSVPVDLVALGLLQLDTENFHVHQDTAASHAVLLIAVQKCPQLFVTARGRLLGIIHASELLARAQKYTL